MSLDSSKIVFRAPLNREQGDSNGGRMSVIAIQSNSPENVFANVFSAQRQAGMVDYQWAYALAAGEVQETLVDAYQYLFGQPPSDAYVCFFIGDMRSNAGDYGLPGADTERKYGPALGLKDDVEAGATTLTLTVKNADHGAGADNCWQDGDAFFISNKAQFDSLSGTTEYKAISGTPAVDGNGVDITINLNTPLGNAYLAAETTISTYPGKADISGNQYDNYDGSGIAGTTVVDITTEGNFIVDSIGALEMTLNFEMTEATTFDVTTDYPGISSLPSGNTTVDYAPINSAWGRAYLTLKAGAITTGQAGDSFSLQVHPPAACIVQKRVVPAGAGSAQGDHITLVLGGES